MQITTIIVLAIICFFMGVAIGTIQESIIQKKRAKHYAYSSNAELSNSSNNSCSEYLISDYKSQFKSGTNYIDDGIEEHSEKYFKCPKDYEFEPISVDITGNPNEQSKRNTEYNKSIISSLDIQNAENVQNVQDVYNVYNTQYELDIDSQEQKYIQTEEQDILDAAMDADTEMVHENDFQDNIY